MKTRPLLFTSEPDALGGNGPAAIVTPAAEAAPAAEATPEPALAAADAEPSFLEKVTASIQSKGKLLADRDAATARAERAEAELAILRPQLARANSDLAQFAAERSGIEAALTAAIAEKQEQDVAVAGEVAALGFEPAALPSASSAPVDTRESIAAQIEKENDPKKLWALAEKFEALSN